MRRPANDAWFEKQLCGPLVVYFKIDDYDADEVTVDWLICPDDEDKSERRALYGSDGEIHGPKNQIDALIDRAMREAREAAVHIGEAILTWARSTDEPT